MRAIRPLALFALLLAVILSAAAASATDIPTGTPSVVLLRAGGAGTGITQEQLITSFKETARAMHVADRELPKVMALYLSKDAARTLGASTTQAHRNTSDGRVYYEIWLVEKAPLVDCAIAMQTILERHFAQTYTDAERRTIITRVLRYVGSTVSAKSYDR